MHHFASFLALSLGFVGVLLLLLEHAQVHA